MHLVYTFTPPDVPSFPSSARIRDDVTFVAFVDAAQHNRMLLEQPIIDVADRIRQGMSPKFQAWYQQRSSELVGRWQQTPARNVEVAALIAGLSDDCRVQ